MKPGPHNAALMNDDAVIRKVITTTIKRCGKSRAQIADEMGTLLGLSVTERMITSFTSESKELHRWPGAWDRAFCAVTGKNDLLRCRIELAGFCMITKAEKALLDVGRSYIDLKRKERRVTGGAA